MHLTKMKKRSENYYIIQPEVIVGIGDNTSGADINDQFGITHLHIKLEDWLGDDLVEVFPCYLITETLKKKLEANMFSGYEFGEVEITKDEYFHNNYQLKKPLPQFYWLIIKGKKNADDIFLDTKFKLNVSPDFLKFLKSDSLSSKYLEINPPLTENDDFLEELFKK
jgi:hypothetical protein